MTLLIPNVFRLLSELEDSTRHVLEFQDLSSKIVLVQGMTCKVGGDDDETKVAEFKAVGEARGSLKNTSGLNSVKQSKKKCRSRFH